MWIKQILKKPSIDEKLEAQTVASGNVCKILAVTGCPTGIVHTYMAAESLEKAAKAANCAIKVETRGSGGAKNVLTEQEIKAMSIADRPGLTVGFVGGMIAAGNYDIMAAVMVGGMVPPCAIALAGALSMAFGCTLMAPHGGIFVFPVVGNSRKCFDVPCGFSRRYSSKCCIIRCS